MKYFSIEELIYSDTAKAKGIDNTPTQEVIDNLTKLVDNVLDPLREAWGGPLLVNSGYRCKALNTAVGGSSTSDHMKGKAADIVPKDKTKEKIKELFALVDKLGLKYDQLINESNYTWMHISYRENANRMQKLKL